MQIRTRIWDWEKIRNKVMIAAESFCAHFDHEYLAEHFELLFREVSNLSRLSVKNDSIKIQCGETAFYFFVPLLIAQVSQDSLRSLEEFSPGIIIQREVRRPGLGEVGHFRNAISFVYKTVPDLNVVYVTPFSVSFLFPPEYESFGETKVHILDYKNQEYLGYVSPDLIIDIALIYDLTIKPKVGIYRYRRVDEKEIRRILKVAAERSE